MTIFLLRSWGRGGAGRAPGPYVGGLFEYAACRVCVLGAGGVECENNA